MWAQGERDQRANQIEHTYPLSSTYHAIVGATPPLPGVWKYNSHESVSQKLRRDSKNGLGGFSFGVSGHRGGHRYLTPSATDSTALRHTSLWVKCTWIATAVRERTPVRAVPHTRRKPDDSILQDYFLTQREHSKWCGREPASTNNVRRDQELTWHVDRRAPAP
eukprot:1190422-Prorocentrum_minimum.AAC.3